MYTKSEIQGITCMHERSDNCLITDKREMSETEIENDTSSSSRPKEQFVKNGTIKNYNIKAIRKEMRLFHVVNFIFSKASLLAG